MANCIKHKKHKWKFEQVADYTDDAAWFECTRCGNVDLLPFKQDSEKRNMGRSERMIKALSE